MRTDDQALVGRALQGDSEAWAGLVDRHGPYVRSIVRAARLTEADASDAFQYVFLELVRHLPDIRSNANLRPWLRNVALRHAIRIREASSRTTSLSDLDEVVAPDEWAMELEAAERRQLVRDALVGLSPRCRSLIDALFFEKVPRPYAQVAASLGLREGSVAMTRQRCLQSLERALRARGLP